MFTTPSIDGGIALDPNVPGRIVLPEKYVYTAQVMMQAFATEVFRYLDKHGSKIRTLSVSPEFIRTERPDYDENHHRWPRYFYTYGCAQTLGGDKHVVAVPVRVFDMPSVCRSNR